MVPVDDAFMEEVLARLAPLGDVTSKKMFGGVGFWESGDMFALIDSGGRLRFKADDTSRGRYEAAGMEAFAPPMPGGRAPMTMPYFQVPDDVLGDDDRFSEWAVEAMAVGHATAKPAKRRR